MRIAILNPTEPLDSNPKRFVRKTKIKGLLKRGIIEAVMVDGEIFKHPVTGHPVYRETSVGALPNDHRSLFAISHEDVKVYVAEDSGVLNPPVDPENLDLAYPERNRSTAIHPHEAFYQLCLLARQGRKQRAAKQRLSDQQEEACA